MEYTNHPSNNSSTLGRSGTVNTNRFGASGNVVGMFL